MFKTVDGIIKNIKKQVNQLNELKTKLGVDADQVAGQIKTLEQTHTSLLVESDRAGRIAGKLEELIQ